MFIIYNAGKKLRNKIKKMDNNHLNVGIQNFNPGP